MNPILEDGLKEFTETMEKCQLTKYMLYRKANERTKSMLAPQLLFAGDMATSLTMPIKVRETMMPLLRKWGYDCLEEIAQEYLNRNPMIVGADQ